MGELRKIYIDNASLSNWVSSEKYTQTMHYFMHVYRVNDGFNIEVGHVSPGK